VSVRRFPNSVTDPYVLTPGLSAQSADGEVDAAEIDKELISARLKQDVLENAGKLHLFVADSVSTSVIYIYSCICAAPHLW